MILICEKIHRDEYCKTEMESRLKIDNLETGVEEIKRKRFNSYRNQ